MFDARSIEDRPVGHSRASPLSPFLLPTSPHSKLRRRINEQQVGLEEKRDEWRKETPLFAAICSDGLPFSSSYLQDSLVLRALALLLPLLLLLAPRMLGFCSCCVPRVSLQRRLRSLAAPATERRRRRWRRTRQRAHTSADGGRALSSSISSKVCWKAREGDNRYTSSLMRSARLLSPLLSGEKNGGSLLSPSSLT